MSSKVIFRLFCPQKAARQSNSLLLKQRNGNYNSTATAEFSTSASTSQSSQTPTKEKYRWKERTEAPQDINISKRLRLVRPGDSISCPYSVNPQRVLIIFLPWLNSKKKHVDKYVQLYLDIGLDVLCVKSKSMDFLWPPASFGVARELSEVLKECGNYDLFIFHSMSIGAFNLTTFRILAKDVQEVSELKKKVCGIIFDSIVIGGGKGGVAKKSENDNNKSDDVGAIDRFVRGIARSFPGGKIVRPILSLIANVYFTVTKKQTLGYYEKAYAVVRDEPEKVPTLLYASENDPMCDKDVVKELVKVWEEEHDIPITLKMWDVSGHAQHLIFHRKDYIDVQRKFLDEVFAQLGTDKVATGSGMSLKSKL